MFMCMFTFCLDNIQIGGSVYKGVGALICVYICMQPIIMCGEYKKAFCLLSYVLIFDTYHQYYDYNSIKIIPKDSQLWYKYQIHVYR